MVAAWFSTWTASRMIVLAEESAKHAAGNAFRGEGNLGGHRVLRLCDSRHPRNQNVRGSPQHVSDVDGRIPQACPPPAEIWVNGPTLSFGTPYFLMPRTTAFPDGRSPTGVRSASGDLGERPRLILRDAVFPITPTDRFARRPQPAGGERSGRNLGERPRLIPRQACTPSSPNKPPSPTAAAHTCDTNQRRSG